MTDNLPDYADGGGDGKDEEEDIDSQKGDLEKFFDNNENFVPVSSKIPFIVGIAQSLPNPPDLKKKPYGHKLFYKKRLSYTQPNLHWL